MGLGSWTKKAWTNTKPQVVPILGGVGGFVASGGNPLGAAAGYVAADKMLNDGKGMDALSQSAGGEQQVNPASMLTPGQNTLLDQNTSLLAGSKDNPGYLSKLFEEYYNMAKSPATSDYEASTWNPVDTYAGLDYNPQSTFMASNYNPGNSYVEPDKYNAGHAYSGTPYDPGNSYDSVNNWEAEFQNGVVNPAMDQMNRAIANTQHSSNLHSSANRAAQDNVRNATLNDLASKRYNNVMNQQQMKMQGTESSLGRLLQNRTNQENLGFQSWNNYYDRMLTDRTNQNALRQQANESALSRGLTHLTNQDQLRQQGAESAQERGLQALMADRSNRQNANQYMQSQIFQNMGNQQTMKYQGLQDAKARQMQGLTGISNLNANALGVNGIEHIVSKQPSLPDWINTGANVANAYNSSKRT